MEATTPTKRRNVIWFESSSVLPDSLFNSSYTDVIIAFLHPHEDLTLFINDTPPTGMGPDWQFSIQQLRQFGKRVWISIGGGGGPIGDWRNINANGVDKAADVIARFVLNIGFSGVDLDYEEDRVMPFQATDLLTNFINALGKRFGRNGPRITMSPTQSQLTWVQTGQPDFKAILQNTGQNVELFNVQFYEGGGPLTLDTFKAVVNAGIPASKIVAGIEAPGSGGTFDCSLMKTIPAILSAFPDTLGAFSWNLRRVNDSSPNWQACLDAALAGQTTCADCPQS